MNPLTKKKFGLVDTAKLICVIVMVVFLVFQLVLPYWTYDSHTKESIRANRIYSEPLVPENRTISIGSYTWLTRDHDDLFGNYDSMINETGGIKNFENEDINQNDITMMPFLCTLLLVFGLVFFLTKWNALWPGMFAFAAGAYSTYMLVADPAGVYKPWEGYCVRVWPATNIYSQEEIVTKYYIGGITYYYQLAAAIALLVVSIFVLIPWFKSVYNWFTVKKRHY